MEGFPALPATLPMVCADVPILAYIPLPVDLRDMNIVLTV